MMKKIIIVIIVVVCSFYTGLFLTKPATCGATCNVGLITVDAQEFSQKAAANTVSIIDVRTPKEFSQGHINHAQNIDFNNKSKFESSLKSLNKSQTYLIYCRSGNRSSQAMKLLSEKGFLNIINLAGGIQSWQSAGLPIHK